jgi:hypothetical protein
LAISTMQAMQTMSWVQRVAELAAASSGARAVAAVLVVDTGFPPRGLVSPQQREIFAV